MDRVQRSGLITLAVLLLTAAGAHFIGSRPGSDASIPERAAAQDPAAWEGVKFLPPEQRELFVGANDFVRPPVRHPLTGLGTRNILDGIEEPPEPPPLAVAEEQAERGAPAAAALLSLDEPQPREAVAPAQAPEARPASLPTGPGTGRDPLHTVRVRENDNLTKIAARELGDGTRWRELADLNLITDPQTIKVGDLLYLPLGDAPAPSPAAGPATPQLSRYTVKPGDTPSEISMQVYGTSKHWREILAANGIADAKGLRAGVELKIPTLDN